MRGQKMNSFSLNPGDIGLGGATATVNNYQGAKLQMQGGNYTHVNRNSGMGN
jgi:hypothetical protein